jgi:hypothetical protein
MIVSQKPCNENGYVKLGTHNFEIVKDYTYLGTILANKNEFRPEIEKRIANANRAYILCTSTSTKEPICIFRA